MWLVPYIKTQPVSNYIKDEDECGSSGAGWCGQSITKKRRDQVLLNPL